MNNILNKIAQMERNAEEIQLASHKVELGLVDDVKKYTQELNKLFPEAVAIEDQLQKMVKDLFPLLNKADAMAKKIKELQTKSDAVQIKFVAAIKELGLNPSESKENFALFDIKDSMESRRESIEFILRQFK